MIRVCVTWALLMHKGAAPGFNLSTKNKRGKESFGDRRDAQVKHSQITLPVPLGIKSWMNPKMPISVVRYRSTTVWLWVLAVSTKDKVGQGSTYDMSDTDCYGTSRFDTEVAWFNTERHARRIVHFG